MRLSLSAFVLLSAVLVTAAPVLEVDPDHLRDLQANPNYEHHRPTFADFVQRSVPAITAADTEAYPPGFRRDTTATASLRCVLLTTS